MPGAGYEGPSPRKRGSAPLTHASSIPGRSIPAQAGFSDPARQPKNNVKVHPRVSGVQRFLGARTAGFLGPSPRVRGSEKEGKAR